MKRFWDKVKVASTLDCWEWAAAKDGNGYGRFSLAGRNERAHRVAWQLAFGAIPAGLFVLHTCDNTSCVNDAHLYLGTKKDNAGDRESRNRGNHAVGKRHGRHTHPGGTSGHKNGRAKLTEAQVEDLLRRHFGSGARKADLARTYGLSKTTVGRIIGGKLWPSVEGRVQPSQSS
jgi:hypothetical protein